MPSPAHQLRRLWIALTSNLWFVPLSLVVGGILLASLLILADLHIGHEWTLGHPVLFGVGAAGARGMLAAIAGSTMTVASLTFSLTVSTLAMASSQYTSRLIRNFMRDRVNQLVLGYFVGLFAYCLVVLRTIRAGDEGQFVPPIAVMGGMVLALASIAFLVYFIHHIAESIQVGTILRRVTDDTLRAIDELFPADAGEPATDVASDVVIGEGHVWWPVEAEAFGYVRSLDAAALLSLAAERDAVVRMCMEVGAFVTPAGALCEIAQPVAPDANLAGDIRAAFDLGPVRTVEQDAAYGIRQIVDIALKALSPGVNDTTTGVMCVSHLAVLLEALAARPIPDRMRATDGVVRLVATGRSFEVLAGLCLDQIRQSAAGNTAVLTALLRATAAAGRRTLAPARRHTLAHHARLVAQLAESSVSCADDREPILRLAVVVRAALAAPAG
ncbi:MAG: DUF2254 domain-containing protein [Deltaproteobacteria bacterium]|nr:DUF2254 domain-containing protein [Myxococcales bacterium]MDP3214112.1 DUF2254 domain-containing protein [Deltaproteobacteria bacterium]